MGYLVPIMAAIGISLACAMISKRGFSINIFITAISISIGILIWTGIAPYYTIVISILLIIGMLFSNTGQPQESVE